MGPEKEVAGLVGRREGTGWNNEGVGWSVGAGGEWTLGEL